jgi:hypothetical protein
MMSDSNIDHTNIDLAEVKAVYKLLASMNDKLDRLILLEERQSNLSLDVKRLVIRVEKVEDRARILEIAESTASVRTSSNSSTISVIVSAVVSVIVGVVVWNVRGG